MEDLSDKGGFDRSAASLGIETGPGEALRRGGSGLPSAGGPGPSPVSPPALGV